MENNKTIYIPNLTLGNTKSVVNMINRIGGEVIIANSPEEMLDAKKIILPGVGSFDSGMRELKAGGWAKVLKKLVIDQNIPILGICLGMQLFFDSSEEGLEAGLGWISGNLKKFNSTEKEKIKIPHMGWNTLTIKKKDSILPDEPNTDARFYFVHSYHALCSNLDCVIATAFHGSEITAAVQKNNIYGVQFHPEKSHRFGMSLLKNYLLI